MIPTISPAFFPPDRGFFSGFPGSTSRLPVFSGAAGASVVTEDTLVSSLMLSPSFAS